ncbi:hypothetical protein GCM10009603_65840 [Nocardiopsis exhalans]
MGDAQEQGGVPLAGSSVRQGRDGSTEGLSFSFDGLSLGFPGLACLGELILHALYVE